MNPAIKIALIAFAATIGAALVTAAATLGGARIQAGSSKPSQSVTPNPTTSTNHQNAQPGNVVPNSSSPTYSPSETPDNKPSASPSPSSIMIKDLIPLTGDSWKSLDSQIDGEPYPDSIWASPCQGNVSSMTYVISKDYKRFKSTIGMDDFSRKIYPTYFIVTGDGKEIYQKEITSGPPSMIDIPVSGIVRFTLQISISSYYTNCDETRVVWANARLEK